MELDTLTKLEGIKLLDSNFFNPLVDHTFFYKVYDCSSLENIPLELLVETINQQRIVRNTLLKEGVFSIEEVGKELERKLSLCNNDLGFYFDCQDKFSPNPFRNYECLGRIMESFVRHNRRFNQHHSEKTSSFISPAAKKQIYDSLNLLAKEIFKSIKLVNEKDIRKNFSEKQMEIYSKFKDYFSFICEAYDLQKDYSMNHEFYKHKNPCDFETDVKLMATAFTLASTDRVIISSLDTDIGRMASFFYGSEKHKQEFGVKLPQNDVLIYTYEAGGFRLRNVRQFPDYYIHSLQLTS